MRINVARAGYFVALALASSLQVLAADKVQPLNVKVGLWELTTAITTGGDLPIPAGLLEKLTPEQRARVEERMKARSSDSTSVSTRKHCLTREQLEKGATFGEDRKSCTRTVVTSTSNKLEMQITCVSQSQNMKSEGTVQVEAIDTERVKGSVRLTVSGDRAADSTSTFTATWIGPICSPPR